MFDEVTWVSVVVALWVGGLLGFGLAAILAAGKRADTHAAIEASYARGVEDERERQRGIRSLAGHKAARTRRGNG